MKRLSDDLRHPVFKCVEQRLCCTESQHFIIKPSICLSGQKIDVTHRVGSQSLVARQASGIVPPWRMEGWSDITPSPTITALPDDNLTQLPKCKRLSIQDILARLINYVSK